VTIYNAPVNGSQVALSGPTSTFTGTIASGTSATFTLSLPSDSTPFANSASYQIELQTTKKQIIAETCNYTD